MRPIILSIIITITNLVSAQTFTNLEPATPLEGVWYSSVAFADVNGDGYEDALVAGMTASMKKTTNLYISSGAGTFTETTGVPFAGVSNSAVAFSDVDSDGDMDVLISGSDNSLSRITKLYTNMGNGNFAENTGSKFEAVEYSAIDFSDIDGDGDEDVLISGRNDERETITRLYTNNGYGVFTKVIETPFEGVENGSIEFADIDNDGDEDVLVTGRNQKEIASTKLYINDGTGSFTATQSTIEQIEQSSVEFADFDNDGDEDLIITGLNELYKPTTKLYLNDGTGNFAEQTNTDLEDFYNGSVAVSDIDNDGDKDLFITGSNDEKHFTKLYTNDGAGNLNETNDTDYLGVFCGAIATSDFNNDGYSDILITGFNNKEKPIAELYINNPAFNADYVAENVLDTDKVNEMQEDEEIMLDEMKTNETENIEIEQGEEIAKQPIKY